VNNNQHKDKPEGQVPSEPILVTRLAVAVATVLGPIDEVKKLDILKTKTKHSHSHSNYEQYMDCLASVQSQVLHKKSVLKESLKRWEQQYFLNNNLKSPTIDDIKKDSLSSNLLKGIQQRNY
jgi:hypothetical protein